MHHHLNLAIITGSSIFKPEILSEPLEFTVNTPYGEIKPVVGNLNGVKVTFLERHGKGHTLLPHQLNYRANLWGLKTLGINRIISTSAVGSLRREITPGSLVIVDQFLDFTKQRPLTFFEGVIHQAHLDCSDPYCPDLREQLAKAASQCHLPAWNGGVYVCTEGPRYETAAEIKMFEILGGDVVGMTGVPEVILARELGICYANLSIVTNFGAGINKVPLSHVEVVKVVKENQEKVFRLLEVCVSTLTDHFHCECGPKRGENNATENS